MTDAATGAETRQIRFAVVMYGGGSLAIYINGIAQELLKMVRATARDRLPSDQFEGTEKVYRRLALLLSDRDLLGRVSVLEDENQIRLILAALLNKDREELKKDQPPLFREVIEEGRRRIVPAPKEKSPPVGVEELTDHALRLGQPQVRFIVDVLSGSSAGGINGVFLAKALVNNQKIDDLKNLWLREGDFEKLLNDKRSVAETKLAKPGQPESLLNSQRMYLKLLDALDGMDQAQTAAEASPNVEELDLHVTVTDYTGVPVPIRLFDRIVTERRHKQFFHFRYDRGENKRSQFARDHNPFLAFAARSTSAFPLAFEPMRLADIDEVIETCRPQYRAGKSASPEWKQFFDSFNLRSTEGAENRYLLDGGALDNKPFGFALETLLERQADVPVDRKLIYIEPSPEFIDRTDGRFKKPDALENLIAQGSTLPRYETIREDLQLLLKRNRLINRVNHIIQNAERDIDTLRVKTEVGGRRVKKREKKESATTELPQTGIEWEDLGLEDIVRYKGLSVVPYYRLRIVSLTDDMARTVTRLIRFNEDSDQFLAIRNLIRVWREDEYKDYRQDQTSTVNKFLRRFDLQYRNRRLRFVLQKAEQLARLDEEILEQIKIRDEIQKQIRPSDDVQQPTGMSELQTVDFQKGGVIIEQLTPSAAIQRELAVDDEHAKTAKKQQLSAVARFFQKELNCIYSDFRNKQKLLKTEPPAEAGEDEPELINAQRYFSAAVEAIKLNTDDLKYLLGQEESEETGAGNVISGFEGEEGIRRAEDFLNNRKPAVKSQINYVAQKLENLYEIGLFDPVREEIGRLLQKEWSPTADRKKAIDELGGPGNLFQAVRAYLWHYYKNFDEYDQISFPILYQTKVGEADTVDIIRISPHDAKSLIDEEDASDGRRKLAGGALFGFGAFLNVAWRQNDIMWGRLDGSERLITALLPTDARYRKLRQLLIEEVQAIILEEEFLRPNTAELAGIFADFLLLRSAGISPEDALRQISASPEGSAGTDLRPLIEAALRDSRVRTVLAEQLSKNWEKTGKIPRSTIEKTLDSPRVRESLGEYLGDNSLIHAVAALTHRISGQKLRKSVQTSLGAETAPAFMKSYYQVNRQLEPQPLLHVISRSTQVIGRLFEGISDKYAGGKNQLQWVARLGQIFWGLIEVAAPNSLLNLFFNHWIKLLYLFQAVLILGATLLSKTEIQQFGIVTLIIITAVHLTVLLLGDLMRRHRFWRGVLMMVGGILLAVSSVCGVLFLLSFFLFNELWETLNIFRSMISQWPIWVKSVPALLIAIGIFVTLAVQETRQRKQAKR